MTHEVRSGGFGLFFLGLFFGATTAGIGVFIWQQREMQRRWNQAQMQTAFRAANDLAGGAMAPVNGPSIPMEDRIKKIGDAIVEDLRLDRLLSVYRLTTKSYQQKMPREQFDEMVHKVPKLRSITTVPSQREAKVRKAADGDSIEYYCTSIVMNQSAVVNVSLLFVEGDNDWRINEIELRQDQ